MTALGAWIALLYHFSSATQTEIQATLPLHNETTFWIGEARSITEHFILYFVLSLCLQASLAAWGAPLSADYRWALGISTVATLYGVLLELLQASVPGRSTSVNDMLTNCAGALAAAIIGPRIIKAFSRAPETTVGPQEPKPPDYWRHDVNDPQH